MKFLVALALLIGVPGIVQALETRLPVDMMLVLAVDVSDSIDATEYQIQKDGIVAALRDQNLKVALEDCNSRGIAITYMEWSGRQQDSNDVRQVVTWTYIKTGRDLAAFADQVAKGSRFAKDSTDIEQALLTSDLLIESSVDYVSDNKVILLSSDGVQNVSPRQKINYLNSAEQDQAVMDASLRATSKRLEQKGDTVHALVIQNEKINSIKTPLDSYFQQNVKAGYGGVVRGVKDFSEYSDALKDILIRVTNQCIG